MGALASIDKKFVDRYLAKEHERHGCRICVDSVPKPYRLVDVDLIESEYLPGFVAKGELPPKCDYVLLCECRDKSVLGLSSIEMKRSGHDVSHAVSQLKAGVDLLKKCVQKLGRHFFMPVLYIGQKQFDKFEYAELEKSTIQFEGKPYRIQHLTGGTDLGTLFDCPPTLTGQGKMRKRVWRGGKARAKKRRGQ